MQEHKQRQLVVLEDDRVLGVVSDVALLPFETVHRPALRFPDPASLEGVQHTALHVLVQPAVRASLDDPAVPVLFRLAEAVDDFALVSDAQGRPAGIITEPAAVRVAAELLRGDDTVAQFRTQRLVALPPSASRSQGCAALIEAGVRHLLLLTHGAPHGVLSVRDLSGNAPVGDNPDPPLHSLTAKKPITIDPTLPVRAAAVMMSDLGIGCLPIVEDGVTVGIVTRTDILRSLADALAHA